MGKIILLYGLLGALPASAQFLLDEDTREVCQTECGTIAFTSYCSEFKLYEKYVRSELTNTVKGYTSKEVCKALNGWHVLIHPPDDVCGGDAWLLGHYMCVYGYTDRKNKIIWLVQENWHSSSLAHEMLHAVDVSLRRPVGHCYWKKKGVHRWLRRVSRTIKDTPPEDVCPNPIGVE